MLRLFRFMGEESARSFFFTGIALAALKAGVDYLLFDFLGLWNPFWFYFVPLTALTQLSSLAGLSVVASAVIFSWLGLALFVRRLRTIGAEPAIAALFFLPIVNALLFLVISIPERRAEDFYSALEKRHLRSRTARLMVGLLVIPAFSAGIAMLGLYLVPVFGWAMFVAMPFMIGYATGTLVRGEAGAIRKSTSATVAVLVFCGTILLLVGFEGAICLLMAVPLVIPLAISGAIIAVLAGGASIRSEVTIAPLLILLPFGLGIERLLATPTQHRVVSEIIVNAPPETVWKNVVGFSRLPEPTELLFQTGVAYPTQATISGEGVGAVRRCEFSTGAFVEPIDVWDPPRRLAFGVSAQPPVMRELSFYEDVTPIHVEQHYLRATRGEFLLVPQPDGSTKIIGTTWYELRFAPAAYWSLWSDAIIHRIHMRVLEHIKREAETSAMTNDLN